MRGAIAAGFQCGGFRDVKDPRGPKRARVRAASCCGPSRNSLVKGHSPITFEREMYFIVLKSNPSKTCEMFGCLVAGRVLPGANGKKPKPHYPHRVRRLRTPSFPAAIRTYQ